MILEIFTFVSWAALLCRGSWATAAFEGVSATGFETTSDSGVPLLETLSAAQQSLFHEAISALDANFKLPLLFNSPRYSAWYSVGLLARNEGGDKDRASDLIRRTIDFQFKDPAKLWYGTFKNDPNAPDPGPLYPPETYGSYDPNVALFVCTSWIIVMEEFQHLLDPALVALMKESMYNATIGDGYRVGGVNMDNCVSYLISEKVMRVMSATYVGNMMGDKNMTMWGDIWASEAIKEFERFDTLSEFNSGTYAGVTLYALSLWGYMPKHSVIVGKASEIISTVWQKIGELYNPSLQTLGGPWDRAYGFDMTSYFGILGGQIAGLIRGSNVSEPIPKPLIGSEHFADVAAVVLTTLISKFHDPYVPAATRARLTQQTFEPHLTTAQAVSPPFDNIAFPRNYTSWNAEGISAGGIEFDMAFVGGASVNPTQFTPAALLWKTPAGQTAWLMHYVSSSSVSAKANNRKLTIAYPPSRAFPGSSIPSNTLSLLISGIPDHPLDLNFGSEGSFNLPGIHLAFSGNIASRASRSLVYGQATLNDLVFYNLTYLIPEEIGGIPELVISFTRL